MTKRTYVTAICNLCEAEIPQGQEVYVTFNLEGTTYGLDLCDSDFLDYKGVLQRYVEKADTVGARSSSTPRSSNGGGSSATALGVDPATVRAWARSQGMDVPEVGRLNLDIINAYQAAQGTPAPQAPSQPEPQPVPLG